MGLFVLLFKFTLISCGGLRAFVGMNPTTLGLILHNGGWAKLAIFWNSPIRAFGQKHPLFLLPAVPVGTSYQRGDDLPETTHLPRALQALFFQPVSPYKPFSAYAADGIPVTPKSRYAAKYLRRRRSFFNDDQPNF